MLFLFFYMAPLSTGSLQWGLPRPFSSLCFTTPMVSACLCGRCPSSVASSWPTLAGLCLFCTEDPRPGWSTPSAVSEGHSRRTESTPFYSIQDTVSLLDCKLTLMAHVQIFVHQNTQWVLLEVCTHVWGCHDPVSGLCIVLVEHHEIPLSPFPTFFHVPLGGISSFSDVNCTTHLVNGTSDHQSKCRLFIVFFVIPML